MNVVIEGALGGAALGLGFAAIFNLYSRRMKSEISTIVLVGASVTILAMIIGVKMALSKWTRHAETEAMISRIESEPLIGEAARRFPEARTVFVNAIKASKSQGSETSGMTLADAGAEVRNKFVVPALRKSPDAEISAAWEAQLAFITHLRSTNVTLCGTFAFQPPDVGKLDSRSREFFANVMRAQEAAMVAGANNPMPPPTASEEDVRKLFSELALPQSASAALQQRQAVPKDEACEAVFTLYSANQHRPLRQKAVLARFIITDGL